MKKAYRKKYGFLIIDIIIIVCVILIYLAMSIPNYKRTVRSRSWENCLRNQHKILGAIEIYDMDHIEKIREINDEVIELLINGKYLNEKESDYVCPDKGGKYHSLGNINKSGFIYCEYHGTKDGIIIKPGMTFMDYVEERERKEKEKISDSLKKDEEEAICKFLCYMGLLSVLFSFIDKIIKYNNKKLKK